MSASVDEERPHQLQFDFFGEPVTFLGEKYDKVTEAMAANDGFLLAVVSKGLTCTGGGAEAGLAVQGAHAVALAWSEALRFAAVGSAPMLGVVTTAPLLAQAGTSYTKHLDALLEHTRPVAPGLPKLSFMGLAQSSIQSMDDPLLNERERMHLQALDLLLREQHSTALRIYHRILRLCPGDALALSLAMDVAQVVGDRTMAARIATTVAAYWYERRGGWITPSIPGHAMISSLIALGLAVDGRREDAEPLADQSMRKGRKFCGALATWAYAHIHDASGRVAEGISALANHDGMVNYEGAGLLFFDCRLSGYGSRFALDREERGRGKSPALRLYESNTERVLNYSGFGRDQAWTRPMIRAPLGWNEPTRIGSGKEDQEDRSERASFWAGMFEGGGLKSSEKQEFEIILKGGELPSTKLENWNPTCEDVLTWLPPTPLLLTESTLMLLRLTLNGTISNKDERWNTMYNSWKTLLSVHKKHNSDAGFLEFSPLIYLSASILLDPDELQGLGSSGATRFARGLNNLGNLVQLGIDKDPAEDTSAVTEIVAERSPKFWLPVDEAERNEWKQVVEDLQSGLDGMNDGFNLSTSDVHYDPSTRIDGWTFDLRPMLEHAIVYACCKAGDIDSLALARSICSQGITLRPSSPEEWWRYSIVIGLLGDEKASEDALNMSINVGGGQGARSTFRTAR